MVRKTRSFLLSEFEDLIRQSLILLVFWNTGLAHELDWSSCLKIHPRCFIWSVRPQYSAYVATLPGTGQVLSTLV